MRLVPAVPETEWRSCWTVFHEVGEVARVIHVMHPAGWRLESALAVQRSGGIARASAGTEIAWSPTLSGETHVIAALLQHVRIHVELRGQRSVQVCPLLQPREPLARQDRAARRRAGGRDGVGMPEQHALMRDAVKSSGVDGAIALARRERPGPIVGNAEKDVG